MCMSSIFVSDDAAIGSRVQELRTKTGLSQAEFAEKLGISLRAFQSYERGERAVSKQFLCGLIEQFEVSSDYILTGTGSTSENLRLAKVSNEIEDDLKEEVIQALRVHLQAYFRSPQSVPAINAFSKVYNLVCHLPSGSDRSTSIRKSIGSFLMGLNQDFMDTIDRSADETFTEAARDILKESTQANRKKIKAKYGLGDNEPASSVSQNFNAEVGQVGGGDIHNYSKKDK